MDDVPDEGMKVWFIERLSTAYKFSPIIWYTLIKLTCDYAFIKAMGALAHPPGELSELKPLPD